MFFYAVFLKSFTLNDLKSTRLKPRYNKRLKIIIIAEQTKKVKNVPSTGRKRFSSINPKIEVGSASRVDAIKNFRYFGFCGQCLFSRIRFNIEVNPYIKVKPTRRAKIPKNLGKKYIDSSMKIPLII